MSFSGKTASAFGVNDDQRHAIDEVYGGVGARVLSLESGVSYFCYRTFSIAEAWNQLQSH